MRLCVVPCGSLKIWDRDPNAGPVKARNAYIGNFAKTCIEYAEKFYPESYVILSARYGFLFPDEIVPENYNVTFKDPKTRPISIEELRTQAEEKGLTKYSEIVVVAGKDYVKIVEKVFYRKENYNTTEWAWWYGADDFGNEKGYKERCRFSTFMIRI